MSSVLVKKEHPDTSIQLGQENPIGKMMEQMIEKGIATPEAAAALEKLADLCLRFDAENAKRAFARARCEMQQSLPRIIATKPVFEKNGDDIRYTYAPFQDIMAAVDPFLSEHGFSVSFSTRIDASDKKDRIVAICKLTHIYGHSETNEFAVRTSGPPGTSDAQADGSTLTYAKRFALCMMLNLSIDHDSDARIEGDYIKPEQADSLKSRVKATGSDEAKFLKLAGAESYEKIRANKYAMVDFLLSKKESEQKQQAKSKKQNKEGTPSNENPVT